MMTLKAASKRLKTTVLGLVICYLAGITAGQAAIFLIDDPTLGISADGLNLTRDTSTGLEWLDLDLSVGRTFNDLTGVDGTNEFIAGGDFAGFRYATHLELTGAVNGPQLDSLYKSLVISPFSFSSIGGYSQARDLIAIAGCFGSCASYGYSNGILLADDGITEAVASMETFTNGGRNWGRSNPFSGPVLNNPPNRPADGYSIQQGNWLVRPINDIPAVPLPAAAWLFGTALIGFIGMSRRRKVA